MGDESATPLRVVAVTYSPGPALEGFLESLATATTRPVEVVLADNGSVDGVPEAGELVRVDESYVRESILNPQLKLVAGYQPLMPTFQGLVNEESVIALVEYVKSLQASRAAGHAGCHTQSRQ